MRWAVGLLLLASCRAVFGLDSPELVDAPGDTAPSEVTGTLSYRYLENDVLGRPALMVTAFDPSDVTIKVTQNDTTMSVDVAQDGTFSFPRSEGTYWLEVQTPSRTVIYELSADHVELLDQIYGRPDPVPLAPQTNLNINVTGRPGGGYSEYVTSSGVYTFNQFKQGFDWSTATFYGPPGVLEASHHDRLYYLAAGAMTANTLVVMFATSSEVTITPGQTTQVSMTAIPVSQNQCVHLNAALGTEAARVAAAVSRTNAVPVGQVSVRSTAAFGTAVGIGLYTEVSAQDLNKSVFYGDPFNWDRYASMYAGVQRMIGTSVITDAVQVFVPLADCNSETKLDRGLVALPTNIQLQGTTLVDGTKITQANATLALSWTTTGERADYFLVNLFPVTQGLESIAATYVTPLPYLTFDRSVLARGQSYVFQITALRGFPNAGGGDFRTTEPITAYGTVFSPQFSVE